MSRKVGCGLRIPPPMKSRGKKRDDNEQEKEQPEIATHTILLRVLYSIARLMSKNSARNDKGRRD